MLSLSQWSMIVAGIASGALGGILLKMGATELRGDISPLEFAIAGFTNGKVLLAMLLYFLPVLIWLRLLRTIDISLLQPILALVYAVTPFLAWLLLDERISGMRIVGIAVVLLGVGIVSRS